MASDWKKEIFQTYNKYKELEASSTFTDYLKKFFGSKDETVIKNFVTDKEKANNQTSFLTKLAGTYFMFAGYLGNPTEKNPGAFGRKEVGDFKNHYGIYDYCTGFVLYWPEAFFRGNWLGDRSSQNACQAFFTLVIPIVPLLAIIRNGLALLATILSFPVVLGVHLAEPLYDKHLVEQKQQREKDELASKKDIDEFNNGFKQLSSLYKSNIESENLSDHRKDEICQTAKTRVDDLKIKVKTIPESVKQYEGLLFKDPTKIGKRIQKLEGKYSAESFEKAFTHGYTKLS